ncbi:peptidoglycan-binding protein [Streptomyces sp. Tu 6176]|uniref:helix-turn-helix domain-containing protein n=1 Tax=Streptomyces sp. Tu 6176 TaxID=1470557 RepID=UPI00044F5D0B|nr:helix-turn-helix domain-containing protein [Streptomyces sp. Tu 6176]EYT81331.1 peptidoglycan-binding protein [Streptomyces sp. Tu 6176]
MPRWTELPDSLEQKVRQLVVQMRRLKDHSGLSLASLAAKTDYSRSSWERYLNGKVLAPRRAVEQLARVTGAEPTRLLVLHELAEQAWQHRDEPSPSTVPPPVPSSSSVPSSSAVAGDARTVPPSSPAPPSASAARREPRRSFSGRALLAAAVAAALAGLAAGLLVGGVRDGNEDATARTTPDTPSSRSASAAPGTAAHGRYVFRPGTSYPCKVQRTGTADDAALSAGYSTTRTAVLAGPGWDVVEAQCLLAYRKLEPGAVDGVYGQQTIAAVMRLQNRSGLPADGVVGPHTWGHCADDRPRP